MRNIIEYRIAVGHSATSFDDLESDVNKLIKKGFQPYSGIHIQDYSKDNDPDTVFYQAMVKYKSGKK